MIIRSLGAKEIKEIKKINFFYDKRVADNLLKKRQRGSAYIGDEKVSFIGGFGAARVGCCVQCFRSMVSLNANATLKTSDHI
jgi:predicted ThiF/HesA family dinucleotide-utilizing enzyme